MTLKVIKKKQKKENLKKKKKKPSMLLPFIIFLLIGLAGGGGFMFVKHSQKERKKAREAELVQMADNRQVLTRTMGEVNRILAVAVEKIVEKKGLAAQADQLKGRSPPTGPAIDKLKAMLTKLELEAAQAGGR